MADDKYYYDQRLEELVEGYGLLKKLNSKQIEIARCYLNAYHGDPSCCNCHKDLKTLDIEDKTIREVKGLEPRVRPLLILNHKKGIPVIHTYSSSGKIIPYGNLGYFCYSCNMKYDKHINITKDETMTWQSKKSVEIRSEFIKLVDNYLAKFVHGCKNRMLYRFANVLNCSVQPLREEMQKKLGVTWDIINRDDFNLECDYCEQYNGDSEHLIIKDKPPIRVKSDSDVAKEENQHKYY